MPSSTLRLVRRRLTAAITQGACAAAPWVPAPLIDAAEWVVGNAGPMAPPLAAIVRRNMEAAGVYHRKALHDYFHQAALHLANGVRIFHSRRTPAVIRGIAEREVALDESARRIGEIAGNGRGGLIAPAHVSNYLVSLIRLREVVPITIYLRWSKDRRKVELKRIWCEAAGLEVMIEPPDSANPVARAMACAEAIRAGKVLAITPDIAQDRDAGTPVLVLDRTVFLPVGPASLAMLCDVPIIPLFSTFRENRQTVYSEEPIYATQLSRAEGGRQEAVRRATQQWADGFTRYVRAAPHGWFLWADSRWTRVFRGDPKYCGTPSVDSPGSPMELPPGAVR